MSIPSNHSDFFDVLRGGSALVVLASHLRGIFILPTFQQPDTILGFFIRHVADWAVMVFSCSAAL